MEFISYYLNTILNLLINRINAFKRLNNLLSLRDHLLGILRYENLKYRNNGCEDR